MCVFWATCSFWNRSDSTAQAPCCEFMSMPVERMLPRTACSHMQSPFEHVIISFYIYTSIIHGLILSLGIVCIPRNPSLRLRTLAHLWPICRFPNLHVLHNVLLTPRLLACSSVRQVARIAGHHRICISALASLVLLWLAHLQIHISCSCFYYTPTRCLLQPATV